MSNKPEQPQDRKSRLTSADLFRALQEGGTEKLRELLAQMDDDVEIVVDQNLLDTMTNTEQQKFLHELFMSKRTFTLHGMRCVYDSGLGPVTTTFGGSFRPPKSHSPE
jgi:ethanolamine ammonia-lyase small subunit